MSLEMYEINVSIEPKHSSEIKGDRGFTEIYVKLLVPFIPVIGDKISFNSHTSLKTTVDESNLPSFVEYLIVYKQGGGQLHHLNGWDYLYERYIKITERYLDSDGSIWLNAERC